MKVILGALAMMTALSALGQAIEFKGTPMGVTPAQFTQQHPEFDCMPNISADTFTRCGSSHVTYAGEETPSAIAFFRADSLAAVNIDIDPKSYGSIVSALHQKYGKPIVTSGTVSNRTGFSTPNETSTWILPSGSIVAQQYGKTLDGGFVLLRSGEELIRSEDERRAKDGKRKSDL